METLWAPDLQGRAKPIYRAIAEALAEDIHENRLEAGTRLPPLRDLAERLAVTVGTVHRAYALAETRGLIERQLGRGTFVRTQTAAAPAGAAADGTVDLSRNQPVEVPLGPTLQRTLAEMAREPDLEGMLDYGHSEGQPRHREILARWIRQRGLGADPERVIVASGAQQALTVALGALTRAGDTLMVEALTYPGIKNLARLFGLRLRAVAMDQDGLIPEDLEAAAAEPGARALYCMPNAHNPTTATLPAERRAAIAEIAERHGLAVIEDDVYPRGAADGPLPIAELAPERTIYISSLSKTVAPGLRVGVIAAPARFHGDLVAVTQTTSWMAPPLMAELACRWIEDGTVTELERARDQITERLQAVAAEALTGLGCRQAPHNSHLWLPLAAPWSGAEFAAKAAERRILVSPAEDFAIDPTRAPAAARICLPNLEEARLAAALGALAGLARGGPGPAEFRM